MAAKSAVVEIVDTVAAHGHRDTKDGKLVGDKSVEAELLQDCGDTGPVMMAR